MASHLFFILQEFIEPQLRGFVLDAKRWSKNKFVWCFLFGKMHLHVISGPRPQRFSWSTSGILFQMLPW